MKAYVLVYRNDPDTYLELLGYSVDPEVAKKHLESYRVVARGKGEWVDGYTIQEIPILM